MSPTQSVGKEDSPSVRPSPDAGTLLALDRTYYAAERTLMAWIRTAISMIGFGFTLAKFFEQLRSRAILPRGPLGRTWGPESVGMALITLGTLSLVLATLENRRVVKGLRRDGLPVRFSLSLSVAAVLAILGVFAFLSIALRF